LGLTVLPVDCRFSLLLAFGDNGSGDSYVSLYTKNASVTHVQPMAYNTDSSIYANECVPSRHV
jgi:hypothetical protein